MGTREGQLWRLENEKWEAQTNLLHAITAIVPGTNGTMWIGTEGDGVYEIERGHARTSEHRQRAAE